MEYKGFTISVRPIGMGYDGKAVSGGNVFTTIGNTARDTIENLKRYIDDHVVGCELAQLRAENAQLRAELAVMTMSNAAVTKEALDLTAERDGWYQAAAAAWSIINPGYDMLPSDLPKQVENLAHVRNLTAAEVKRLRAELAAANAALAGIEADVEEGLAENERYKNALQRNSQFITGSSNRQTSTI